MFENKRIFTVSEVNKYVKMILDNEDFLNNICIRGEISNLSTYSSGHLYFTIKDLNAQISATMFKSYAQKLSFKLENGMKVIAQGSISLYEARGTYQINVFALEPDGLGALALRYEQLKQKFQQEGYFDESHKKPLPKFPDEIGVITSPTGAAVCDIINIATRRWPISKICVYPAIVQGKEAPESLINGVRFFNDKKKVDVIIIGRGGGSIEDLWGFNDERLVKTIYESKIPIISAVGHEVDFTLCDFVSDKRAPTPSAAAEIAVPSSNDMYGMLSQYEKRLNKSIEHKVSIGKERLDKLKSSQALVNPKKFLLAKQRDFELLKKDFLNSKDKYFDAKRQDVDYLEKELIDNMAYLVDRKKNNLAQSAGKLSTLDPLKIISRGYSVAYHEGSVVKEVSKIKVGDEININVSDGTIKTNVIDIEKKKGKKKNG